MNRIRQYDDEYQVLVTPHQKYNNSFEFLLGSWTDVGLSGFDVKKFDNYVDAENDALQYPDINWKQLIDYHRDNYDNLKSIILDLINKLRFVVIFSARLMTHSELKNTTFDRILHERDNIDFRLVYDLNDIICFKITNPWYDNLLELEKFLVKHNELRIFDRSEKGKIIHLTGRTTIGTTYEIVLCPDLINNLLEWRKKNDINTKKMIKYHSNILQTQNVIDKSFRIR